MKFELDVFCVGEFVCWVGEGVFEVLVFELEFVVVELLVILLLLFKKERWCLLVRINFFFIGVFF